MGLRWPPWSRMVSGKSVSKEGGIPRVSHLMRAGSLLLNPRAAQFALAERSVGAKRLLTGKVRTLSAELQRNLMHRSMVSLSARMSQNPVT